MPKRNCLVEQIQALVDPRDIIEFALCRLHNKLSPKHPPGTGNFDEKDGKWAAEFLTQRGFKLPAQTVEVARVDVEPDCDVTVLSSEELAAIVADG